MNGFKKILNTLAVVFLTSIMILGGLNHVLNPEFYNSFIPNFFPKLLVNHASAIAEICVGVLILIPKWRHMGALLFIGLMLAFLPIHVWDYLKESPAIGSKDLALIRIVVQFALMGMGYLVFKRTSPVAK